jgi:multidrug resistance protein
MSSIFTKKQKQSITAMALALGLRVFGVSLFLPVFTLFGNELTHNGMLIGLALGVYGLVQALLQVPYGALSDRFGRKRIILIGLFLYALGSIMAAESQDIYFLIFARVLQGAGAISGAVYAYIADVIEPEKRSRAMGLLGMPMGIAFSLGIVLGPIVASWWSVRALFVLCAILVAWAFLYIQSTLEEPRKSPAHTELSIMPGQIWELLHNRRLISVNLGGFITNFFQVGIFVILPLLTVRYRTMSDFWELIVPMVVIGTLIMLWGARQADAGKSKQMTQLAFSFLGLSALTFLIPAYGMLPYPEWNFRVLILSGVLFFAGFSMTQPLLSAGVTKLASENRVGATSGLYNMSQNMGTFFGGRLGGTFMANHANIFLLIMCFLGIWGANTVGRSMHQGGDNKCK